MARGWAAYYVERTCSAAGSNDLVADEAVVSSAACCLLGTAKVDNLVAIRAILASMGWRAKRRARLERHIGMVAMVLRDYDVPPDRLDELAMGWVETGKSPEFMRQWLDVGCISGRAAMDLRKEGVTLEEAGLPYVEGQTIASSLCANEITMKHVTEYLSAYRLSGGSL